MERKASLVPHNDIPHVRTLYHDFCPNPPLCPGYGDGGGRFSVITGHGKLQLSMIHVLDVILIVPHLAFGPGVLPDPIWREVSRPRPAHHPPTCKRRKKAIHSRHRLPETLVATSTIDQCLELDWLLNPLPVPTRSLSHPPNLPRHSWPTHPFFRSRGIGLRVCKDRFANMAITFVVSLHWVGRLCGPAFS